MIQRAFQMFSSEARGLQQAAYILAIFAFLSSFLALVRDRLFAHTFGAGTELDLYYAAFRIPDLIFVVTGALVSVYVLIPELSRRTEKEQKDYVDTIFAGFSMLSVGLSIAAALGAPYFLRALFPHIVESGHLSTLVDLTRIMLLQPIFLGFSNILAALTQMRGRYALYSISPLLYNAGIIAGLIVLYPFLGMAGLAWGVVLGALMHAGVQVPPLMREGFLRALPLVRDARALVSTAIVSVPRALALSMNQVVILGLVSFASQLAPGSIAVFMLAFNLQAVPLAIIGASYSVAAFPALASAIARGEREEFLDHIAAAARFVIFWSLPALALIIVLRAHIVRSVLGSGAFDWTDTRLTAALFAVLSISLVSQGLSLLLTRGYYAAGRTFTPFFAAATGAAASLGLAYVLLGVSGNEGALSFAQAVFRLEDVPGSRVLALALSYAVVSIFSTFALAAHFEYRFGSFFSRVRNTLWQGACASVCAGITAYGVLFALGPLTLSSTLLSVMVRGGIAGIGGIAAAALVYALFGNREFTETVYGIRSRLWRLAPSREPIVSAEDVAQ